MDGLFQIRKEGYTLSPATKIIKRDELVRLLSLQEVVATTEAQVAARTKQAEEDYQRRYAEGLAEGRLTGQMEYGEKLMDVALESLNALSEVESSLVEVVIKSVRKILGAFEPDELNLLLVKNTLGQVRGEKQIIIRVNRSDEPMLRQSLKDYLISSDGRSGYVELVADNQLKRSSCVIETSLGIVDGSLDTQLHTLETLLRSQFVNNATAAAE